jgi:hypothetical protein
VLEAHGLLQWKNKRGNLQMLRQIAKILRGGREARRNRVWVILINKNGPLLLSPEYFKWFQKGKDQIFERKPARATSRLEKCFPSWSFSVQLTYLKCFVLKGCSTYKDLHVFYAIVLASVDIPQYIAAHLTELCADEPQQREVRDALEAVLASNDRYTLLQLQVSGALAS